MGTSRSSMIKKEYIYNKVNSMGAVGLGYNKDKLIAEFILDCNTSRKTALEFLKTFEDAERIIIKDGIVYSLAFFNKSLSIKEELSNEENTLLSN